MMTDRTLHVSILIGIVSVDSYIRSQEKSDRYIQNSAIAHLSKFRPSIRLNISRERAQQLEGKALRKPEAREQVHSYLENLG
jgi:hypothetical protein